MNHSPYPAFRDDAAGHVVALEAAQDLAARVAGLERGHHAVAGGLDRLPQFGDPGRERAPEEAHPGLVGGDGVLVQRAPEVDEEEVAGADGVAGVARIVVGVGGRGPDPDDAVGVHGCAAPGQLGADPGGEGTLRDGVASGDVVRRAGEGVPCQGLDQLRGAAVFLALHGRPHRVEGGDEVAGAVKLDPGRFDDVPYSGW